MEGCGVGSHGRGAMKSKHNTNSDNQPNSTPNRRQRQAKKPAAKKPDERTDEADYQKLPPGLRPYAGCAQRDPLDYLSHPYPSMRRFAELLALRFDAPRTRHSYYRQMRLVHEFCQADPAAITEAMLRDYILHVKTVKRWKPKTIRQSAAAAKLFFIELMEHEEWKIFSQIRTKDDNSLPAVLTREEVKRLLRHIRMRRYRTPVKLIYCCGLRLSECLSLTIHDIDATGGKLWIRKSKNHKDRMVPISQTLIEDLRRYWAFHRHPLLIFPSAGRGDNDSKKPPRAWARPPARCPSVPCNGSSSRHARNSTFPSAPCTLCAIPSRPISSKPVPACIPSRPC